MLQSLIFFSQHLGRWYCSIWSGHIMLFQSPRVMENAAVAEPSKFHFPFGRGQVETMLKRKTPAELRGEQLKRRSTDRSGGSQGVSLPPKDQLNFGATHVPKKSEPFKNPKYIELRVNEVFPVKKHGNRLMVHGKENSKDSFNNDKFINLDNSHPVCNPYAVDTHDEGKNHESTCDEVEECVILERPAPISGASNAQVFSKIDKCSQISFKSVAELSLGSERSKCDANIDMEKALKGLVSHGRPATSDSSSIPFSRKFLAEFQISGNKFPIDFSLKTSLRLVSSSSVRWCHRLFSGSLSDALSKFSSCHGCSVQNDKCESGFTASADVLFCKALHSWTYPQSSLPPSTISFMSLSTSSADIDFLKKRNQDWVDSFHNLYFMLRRDKCRLFYVYTSQFIVLFIGGSFTGRKSHCCNAYMSQSTHGLRSLLAEHGISFSMPLCHSQQEQATTDDLFELWEIEKRHLGQTVHLDSLSHVDNKPQSLLAFLGNKSVHALYDFLLNYRFFLTSLTNFDVPMLLAPLAFQNASISLPKVRCKEIKKADVGSEADAAETIPTTVPTSVCYSIEVKDEILPPWVISRICAAMGSRGSSFELSLTTDAQSVGLNVVLDSTSAKSDSSMVPDIDSILTFHIPNSTVLSELRSACLTGLSYANGSYTAFVTPV